MKSYRFCPFLGQLLVDVQKTQKQRKNYRFEGLLSGPSKGYYLGQVCCNIKMANLAQIITLQIFVHTLQNVETPIFPIFIAFFCKQCFTKNKLGPDNNSTATYIYIVVESVIGPSLGVFKVINWSKIVSFKHCLSKTR